MHTTVLLEEAVEGLSLKKGMTVVDATLGEGGHSALIAEKIGSKNGDGRLIAIDRDSESIERAKSKLADATCRIDYVEGNFADLTAILVDLGIPAIDGIVFDLGWNS